MRNVAELLASKTAARPRAEYMRLRSDDGVLTRISREAFSRQAAVWAAYLTEQGIGRGDRVGIVSEKSPAAMRAFFAVFSTGAACLPVAEELPAPELDFIFTDAAPKLVLTSELFEAKVREAAGDIPVVLLSSLPDGPGGEYQVGPAEENDVACLIYTSGSTGRPKGVMLTHRNFLANSLSASRIIEADTRDVVMSILPFWHSFALTVELFTLLQVGGVVAMPRDKRDFSRNLGAYKPTIVLIVPRIAEVLRQSIENSIEKAPPWKRNLFMRALGNAERVCRDDPGDGGSLFDRLMRRVYLATVLRPIREHFGGELRFFVSGGAPLEKDHQVFFKRLGVPIYQGYGLTESTPVISAGNHHAHRLGSSGLLASWLFPEEGGDFTFLTPEGERGKQLRGELLVRGDCTMRGYWNREEETAAALRDGWLHTGDLGWVDDNNYLFLAGRKSSLICLVGGEKFHPEPVEERLKTSPLIGDCCVFGEQRKNAYALIAPDAEHTADMAPTELRELLKGEITRLLNDTPGHWRPKDFALVDPFTMEGGLLTSMLKIKRSAVFKQYARLVEAIEVRNGERTTKA